jgi:hypothetical protein
MPLVEQHSLELENVFFLRRAAAALSVVRPIDLPGA